MTKKTLLTVIKAIGDLSADGLLFYTVGSKNFDYANDAMLRIFDISHKSFRTQPQFFVNHVLTEDVDYLNSSYRALLAEDKIENIEFRLKSHDGDLKIVSASCYLLEDRKYVVGFIKDVTRIREHENYIINYGAKKNTLLDMVTHNLSAPLSVSKNILESLETIIERGDLKNVRAHLQLIRENTRHCIDVVNDFLEEEHLVSEHIFVKVNRFEVTSKINEVLERFRKSYPDYKFLLHKNFNSMYLNTDDVKFLQVFNNLLSNAVKWSPAGSKVEIYLTAHDDKFTLTVKDNGVGIPDHLKPHLFQKHTPASRPGLRGEKSIGMGLYIVEKLVNLMQGSVSYESTVHEGTTMTIELPSLESDE
jgi:two-component system sensor histidine kinase VicK